MEDSLESRSLWIVMQMLCSQLTSSSHAAFSSSDCLSWPPPCTDFFFYIITFICNFGLLIHGPSWLSDRPLSVIFFISFRFRFWLPDASATPGNPGSPSPSALCTARHTWPPHRPVGRQPWGICNKSGDSLTAPFIYLRGICHLTTHQCW